MTDFFSSIQAQATQAQGSNVSLNEIITTESLLKLIEDEDVKKELVQHLPEEQKSIENVQANLQSPQLRQAMDQLTLAIKSDQI